MRMLLDSHAFVWFVLGHPKCSSKARETITQSGAIVFVSAATAWELATKVRIGKWPDAEAIVQDLSAILANHDLIPLPVALEHGRVAGLFTNTHKDPFDRMLAAQAQVEDVPLITADPKLDEFGIRTIW